MFKAITGGDSISAECKFRDSFDFVPYARLVFSANNPPRSDDESQAFFRRWVVVPFDLEISDADKIPGDKLNATLGSPAELSGLLNHALAGLKRIKEQKGFTEPESVREAFDEFRTMTNPLAVWLERYTLDGPDALVPCVALQGAYNAEAERKGRSPMTNTAFGAALRNLRNKVERKQRTVHGNAQWCYVGIGMTHGTYIQDTRESFT